MHPERIKSYVSRIAEVVDGATNVSDHTPIPRPRTDGSNSYAIKDDVEKKQASIARDLLKKDGWVKKVSQEFVGRRISKIISANVGTKDNSGIALMFSKLVEDYENLKQEITVLIPLEGIVLKVPDLQLGKIRLVNATSEYLEHLRLEAKAISAETIGDESVKADSLKSLNDMIDQFKNSVCAERIIMAEDTRAREIARDELRLTVAILNFLGDALAPDFHNVRVGLKGEFSRGQRIELTRENGSMRWQQTRTGPLAPLFIDEKALKLMDELKIRELADLVTQDNFDAEKSFEGTLLTAIHFHSHARELPDRTDKVLSYVTAIEALFETTGKSIAATIANGCALILCDSLEDRKKMKALMKRLYGLRSSISHFGKRTVIESDLAELSFVSWSLISYLTTTRDRFQTKADFNSWAEDLELGYPSDLSIVTFRK